MGRLGGIVVGELAVPNPSNAYLEFWSLVLGVSADDLADPRPQVSHRGRYLASRGPDRLFLWRDLVGGKVVVAADQSLGQHLTLAALDPVHRQSLLTRLGFSEEYDDVDYCWPETRPANADSPGTDSVHRLTGNSEQAFDAFASLCSEDEIDTLDLDLKTDVAFGFFQAEQLVGVARSAAISGTQLADLTVLVWTNLRNQGVASSLVKRLVVEVLSQERIPKYRVATTNLASQRVAERNGFLKRYQLTTFARMP